MKPGTVHKATSSMVMGVVVGVVVWPRRSRTVREMGISPVWQVRRMCSVASMAGPWDPVGATVISPVCEPAEYRPGMDTQGRTLPRLVRRVVVNPVADYQELT